MAGAVFFTVVIVSCITGLRLTENFTGHLITFFSILFGFFLTAASVLFGTNFSKRLNDEVDPLKLTRTKLNTLVVYFNFSLFISLLSIILPLLISLLDMTVNTQSSPIAECSYLWKDFLCWSQFLAGISLGLAATNMMIMFLLFQVFFNGLVEEAS